MPIILTSFHSSAQYHLDGTIVDENATPIEFVNVIAMSTDTSNKIKVLVGATTDSLGSFRLTVSRGEYLIVTRSLNLESDTIKVQVDGHLVLPIIQLEKQNVLLGEVTVVAKQSQIERLVDRVVFNFGNAVFVDGGTAIDALKVTPGVMVEGGKISMLGKQSFQLFINGKDQNLSPQQVIDFLQSMDAKRIKNIEVITTPPANFDAGGNIGIININLKSPLHDSWRAYLRGNQNLATYMENSVHGKLSIKKGKFGLTLSSSYSFGKWLNISEQEVYYDNENFYSRNLAVDYSDRFNWGISGSYDFSSQNQLSFNYNGTLKTPLSETSTLSILSQPSSSLVDSTIQTNFERFSDYLSNSGTLRFEHVFDTTGRKAILTADCFTLREQNDQRYRATTESENESDLASNENNGSRNIQNYSTKLDFILPSTFASLEVGVKYTHTLSESLINNTLTASDSVLSQDQFKFIENTFSGYFSGKKDLSRKLKLKVGLRLESTQTSGITTAKNKKNTFNYTELFPTTHLSYAVSKDHRLYLEYGRRIHRPRFSMLNPFKIYISPFSYVSGNPLLRPSFSNEIRIGHLFKGNLSSAIFYKKVDNDFSLLTILEEGTLNQGSVQQNYLNREEFGLSQSVRLTIKKWFSSYLSATVSYRKVRSNNSSTRPSSEGLSGFIYSSNSVYLNSKKTLSLNAEFSYSLPSIYGIDTYAPVFVTNTSLRMMFLQKKLVVDIAMNDVFASNKIQWTTQINGLEVYNSYRSDNPYFSFAISYSFGNKNVQSSRTKSGNSIEQMRSR